MAHTVIAEFACKPAKGPEFLEIPVNALSWNRRGESYRRRTGVVTPERFERPAVWFEAKCSIR